MKTVTLNGTKYNIMLSGPVDGFTDDPRSTGYSLVVCRDLATRAGLETVIHEASHVLYPGMSEERIEQSTRDLARLLWGLGYRHTP